MGDGVELDKVAVDSQLSSCCSKVKKKMFCTGAAGGRGCWLLRAFSKCLKGSKLQKSTESCLLSKILNRKYYRQEVEHARVLELHNIAGITKSAHPNTLIVRSHAERHVYPCQWFTNSANSFGGLTAAFFALMLYNIEQLVWESALHNGNIKWKLNQ